MTTTGRVARCINGVEMDMDLCDHCMGMQCLPSLIKCEYCGQLFCSQCVPEPETGVCYCTVCTDNVIFCSKSCKTGYYQGFRRSVPARASLRSNSSNDYNF
jgi:hypothetical protein